MARLLLTGGSSSTGLWIAEALAVAGHQVTAPLRRSASGYSGLRAERVERLGDCAQVIFETPFASHAFEDLAGSGFDLLAHHAADIPNYRASDYDVAEGFNRNIAGAQAVFSALARSGAIGVIATGTTFEAHEGQGDAGHVAISPYGLSKTLTNETLRHFARWKGLRFGKFVIAAPFGPLEEGRFAWSLFQRWFDGKAGEVRTPRYVRDNIPAPLLARAYAALVDRILIDGSAEEQVARPSGFVGTQEAFARLLAREMAPRLGLECAVEALAQQRLLEPEVRINTDPWLSADWDATAFWDEYAAYYQRIAANGLLRAPA